MKKLLLSLLSPVVQSSWLADAILAIPRILCGYFLAVNFGGSKFGVPWSPEGTDLALLQVAEWFPEDVAEFGGIFALAPFFFAWMAAASEAIGGALLALGLKTRLSAFLMVCTMLVAIFFQKWDQGLWGMLPALGFLWVALYSLVLGSGRFGLDYLITKKWRQYLDRDQVASMSNVQTSLGFKALGLFCLMSIGVYATQPEAETYQVSFQIDLRQEEKVESVGLRGDIEPLSWEKDWLLTDEDQDGIYEATITLTTTKRRVAYKFLLNGEWELEGEDNRILPLGQTNQTAQHVYNQLNFLSEEKLEALTYTPAEIKEDVGILKKTLEYIHPNLYKYQSEEELAAAFVQLEKEMLANPNLTNAYQAVSRFATHIQCSHTFTNPWNQGTTIKEALFFQPDKLPFTFSRIGTRLFIDKNASKETRLAPGVEILAINGVPAQDILPQLTQYITSDGSNYEKRLQRLTLSGTEKYELFDIFFPLEFGSTEQFELSLKDHQTDRTFTTTVKGQSKTQRTAILKKRYPDFTATIADGWQFKLLDDQTAYLKMQTFAIYGKEFDWRTFLERAFDQMKKESTSNLIIDIRGNEGGVDEIPEYLMERLLKQPVKVPAATSYTAYQKIPDSLATYVSTWDRQPYDWGKKVKLREDGKFATKSTGSKTYKPKKDGFRGEVYLITDPTNSSATHLMATYIKKYQLAKIVGQTTGGNQRGLNGGYMFFHRLPNTGIELDIPVFGIHPFPVDATTPDGGIVPDVVVEKQVEDLIQGTDTELETILTMIRR